MHLESNAIYQIESVLNKNFKKINEVMYSIQKKKSICFHTTVFTNVGVVPLI